jgi:DNA-directed RNA polymerase specialized sigma24 family protein
MPFKQHPTNPDLVVYHPNEYEVTFTRAWVGLTDEEIAQTVGSPLDEVYLSDFRRVIAKLKERNVLS